MSKLENLATFVEVARAGSFSAAARQLQVPRSTISFRIATLERTLNLRLLKRSTRSVTLTQEGRDLYHSSANLLADLNDALDRVGLPINLLRGNICLSVPSDLPQGPLVEAITSFRAANPEVSFEIRFTNEVLDLVKENIDVAVRLGMDDGAEVVRRKVLDIPCGFFAHRRWIELNGMPLELTQARDLIYPVKRAWVLLKALRDSGELAPPAVNVNSFAMIRSMVLIGSGIGLLPKSLIKTDLEAGEVVEVMEKVALPCLQMHLSFATRSDITPRVRAFADHLATFM
jgi:DNA-binding transcriptional LysR family regulator